MCFDLALQRYEDFSNLAREKCILNAQIENDHELPLTCLLLTSCLTLIQVLFHLLPLEGVGLLFLNM